MWARTTVSSTPTFVVSRRSRVSKEMNNSLSREMRMPTGPLHPIYGYEQGIAIARRIASMVSPPDIVYSSSLHRAVSTSQLIVHALGKTKNSIRIEDGLVEWLTPSVCLVMVSYAMFLNSDQTFAPGRIFTFRSLNFSSSLLSRTALVSNHALCNN